MKINLLIIEKDQAFRSNIVRHLQQQKAIRVLQTGLPQTALAAVSREALDVVLLGLNGLKQEGLQLLKMIREAAPSVPIITISSPESIDLSIAGMKLGVYDDLMMPFEIKTLLERIAAARRKDIGGAKRNKAPSS
jgi:DNA-binding response OmpR family regulator